MIIITITVRTKSERLPLKVLRLIEGKAMIEQMIIRLKEAKLADEIVLCTSTNPKDEVLVDYAEKQKIKYFRGDEVDVLKRLYDAATVFGAEFIVNATADNPLTDPVYIDKIIEKYRETKADYITCLDLPIGTYSEGVKTEAMKKVLDLKKEQDTEIWDDYFEKSGLFKVVKLEVEKELIRPGIRLTVDYSEDLELLRKIYNALQKEKEVFSLKRVLEFLKENPELLDINKNMMQKKAPEINLQPFKK